jgi:hypothetical protein
MPTNQRNMQEALKNEICGETKARKRKMSAMIRLIKPENNDSEVLNKEREL